MRMCMLHALAVLLLAFQMETMRLANSPARVLCSQHCGPFLLYWNGPYIHRVSYDLCRFASI